MKISEIIMNKYKLRMPPTVYYDLLEDVVEVEEEQEPTTKNDLALIHTEGLDEEIRCTMCTNYMKSDRGCDGSCVVDKDMYKAVMDAIEKRIQSSVTPQEPKIGHWIAYEVQLPDRTILNYRCSVCGRKLIGYNTETLSEAPFCHCGAKMVEPQVSEE